MCQRKRGTVQNSTGSKKRDLEQCGSLLSLLPLSVDAGSAPELAGALIVRRKPRDNRAVRSRATSLGRSRMRLRRIAPLQSGSKPSKPRHSNSPVTQAL